MTTPATRLTWLTCRVLPEPDPDEAPAMTALERAGFQVTRAAWDDDKIDWSNFDAGILRSAWDYYEDPEKFSNWTIEVSKHLRLFNSGAVVRWNLHKRYLAELEREGIAIVPTLFVQRTENVDLQAAMNSRGWNDVVIKPAVSAGSFCTRRFAEGQTKAAQQFLNEHSAQRDMLVQVFVPSVATTGERSAIWIDGKFTHVVIKQPRFSEDDESVSQALEVPEAEAKLGAKILATACQRLSSPLSELLYARVDTVEWQGERVLSELELIEPSLFFVQAPWALERFVAGLKNR